MRTPLAAAVLAISAAVAAAQGGPILAPTVVDGGRWQGRFTPAHGL